MFFSFFQHGESENNFSGKIGGDANLSSRGRAYAAALANYVNSLDFQCPVEVWTSGLRRTIATAAGVKCNQRKSMKELNELHAVSLAFFFEEFFFSGWFFISHLIRDFP